MADGVTRLKYTEYPNEGLPVVVMTFQPEEGELLLTVDAHGVHDRQQTINMLEAVVMTLKDGLTADPVPEQPAMEPTHVPFNPQPRSVQ